MVVAGFEAVLTLVEVLLLAVGSGAEESSCVVVDTSCVDAGE